MPTPVFFRSLVRQARAHPRLAWALLGVALWVGGCFALGYQVPGFDQHPDWSEFPHLSNPRLVAEYLPDSILLAHYGHRFALPPEGIDQTFYDDSYRTNLRNVRSLGYQITENEFESGIVFLPNTWTGTASMGHTAKKRWRNGFHPEGYQYLSLQLGTEVGGFKEPFRGSPDSAFTDNRSLFYQYNQPRTRRDTLYLRYGNASWRVFYR